MPDSETLRLAQELIKRKITTVTCARECLADYEQMTQSGRAVSLGSLLVTRGVVGLETLKEVLSAIGDLYLGCPQCRTINRISGYDRKLEYNCAKCSAELAFLPSGKLEEEPGAMAPDPRAAAVPVSGPTSSTAAMPAAGSHSPPPATDEVTFNPQDVVGRQVGGCIVRELIASGGMGSVFKAEQLNLGRTVALKILAPELASDETFVKRFTLEARSAAELSHVNLVHIIDCGQADGLFYYTMEYVEGENLRQRLLREGRLDVDLCLEICDQVAAGLEHAHAKRIIHRDIKPENVILTPEGIAKVSDLGLAKKTVDDEDQLTQAGSILGTPHYMAPEQARDFRKADSRSDLYSLGVTMYKMLSGEVPFAGSSPIEIMMKAVEGNKADLRTLRPELSARVARFVDRAMHVDPSQRFQSASEMRTALTELRRETAW